MSSLARFLILLMLATLSACGGGGSGASASGSAPTPTVPTPPPAVPPNPGMPPSSPVPVTPEPQVHLTTIALQSDAGDNIGLGKTYAYDKSTAQIEVSSEKNRLVVQVTGDESWVGIFQTGGAQSQLQVGMVADSVRFEDDGNFSRASHGWSGEGRYCNSSIGWFSVDSVTYTGPTLTQVTLSFVRHCNGATPALHGQIRYFADDATKPPPPVLPVPATLWRPPADFANSVGNSAYFESEEGDYVGLGKRYAYDQRSAAVTLSGAGQYLSIDVKGNERWSAELRGMNNDSHNVEPGYYPAVHGSRFNNPVKGGLSWTGEGRGCRVSNGWFAVDAITIEQGLLTSIDLRFEQHCEGRAAALHGAIHWSDPTRVTWPAVDGNTAVGSWSAPAARLPSSGNYLYMQSDTGEGIAKGLVDLQTGANAIVSATAADDHSLTVEGHGVHSWRAEFINKLGQSRFVPGNYAGMAGYPFASASAAALSVYGDYAASEPKGWLVIDSIAYADNKLVALDARFEQLGANRIGNDYGLLHGQVHWRADQASVLPGPAALAPADFWRPPSGATPAIGNYVYMESDRSDFIGNQAAYLYTPLDSLFTVTGAGIEAQFDLRGDQIWNGALRGIAGLGQIQAGYYAGQSNASYGNPARGRFNWGGDGRGCNEAVSGVVVDKVTYQGSVLTELNLRFEQHCEGEPGALRGEIHWSASDARVPQGPPALPANLGRAPAGALPASGNYLYVDSQPGAMGGGMVGLMTARDTTFFANTSTPTSVEAYFGFNAQSAILGVWRVDLQAMVGLKQFQVGYYDRTLRFPFHNKAFGGLDVSANYSGCNTSIGWFAIDKASYVGDTLTALHARFEHHCEMLAPAAHGEINWEASPAALMAARLKPQTAMPGKSGARPLLEGPARASKRR